MTVRMTIPLPDGLAEMVERLVAEGRYASRSDVIRDGLRALEERLAAIRLDLEARLEEPSVTMEVGDRMLAQWRAERRKQDKAG